MRGNHFPCPVSPVCQNICGQYLNDFYIFLARKFASSGHSAYRRNYYGRLSHLREKHGKSPHKFCRISIHGNINFHRMYFFSIYLSIMETTGRYPPTCVCFVLLYCCLDMLMASCFRGAKPILGRKKSRLRNHTIIRPVWRRAYKTQMQEGKIVSCLK